MTKAYEQGFMDKCAEHGVDGRALAKQAGLGDMFGKGIAGLISGFGKSRPKWLSRYATLMDGAPRQTARLKANAEAADKAIKGFFNDPAVKNMGKDPGEIMKFLSDNQPYLNDYIETLNPLISKANARYGELDNLRRAILMARLGTAGGLGVAGGLGGYGLYRAFRPSEPEYPWSKYM